MFARRRRLLLTTDHIHQNGRGAALIAEVIDVSMLQAGLGADRCQPQAGSGVPPRSASNWRR